MLALTEQFGSCRPLYQAVIGSQWHAREPVGRLLVARVVLLIVTTPRARRSHDL